jgi:hypothetical protein
LAEIEPVRLIDVVSLNSRLKGLSRTCIESNKEEEEEEEEAVQRKSVRVSGEAAGSWVGLMGESGGAREDL